MKKRCSKCRRKVKGKLKTADEAFMEMHYRNLTRSLMMELSKKQTWLDFISRKEQKPKSPLIRLWLWLTFIPEPDYGECR